MVLTTVSVAADAFMVFQLSQMAHPTRISDAGLTEAGRS
jgi:hypothetical protein